MQHPYPDPAVRPQWDVDLGRKNRNPEGMSLRALVCEDFETHGRDLFSQGFWALAVHRFGNWRMGVRSGLLRTPLSLVYRFMFRLVEWTGGISLAYTVKVGRRVHIWHHSGMIFGALEIGDDVQLRQNVTMGVRRHGDPRWMKPIIGNGCHIGAGAVVVGPIVIGENSVVGANVVIASDVPPESLVRPPAPTIRPLRHPVENTPDATLAARDTN